MIVTAYNQDWVLGETLASVAAQTYRPLECVIVNDGSTDRTSEVIAEFVKAHGDDVSVKPIHQTNQGAQIARNTGVQASSGEFIQFLDGDDLIMPDKLERQIRFLSSVEGSCADVVYGDAQWLHDNGETVERGEKLGLGPAKDIVVSLLGLVRFNPPFSYLSRRVAVERCGGWDRQLRINDDVEYFLRMACRSLEQKKDFAYFPLITGLYRKHRHGRMSDGGMLLRACYGLVIYESIEKLMTTAGLLTPERRRALAGAYYGVSGWASAFDDDIWHRSLVHALRLDPELQPKRFVSRCLQRAVGTWRSEQALRHARTLKQRLRRSLVSRR